MKDKVTRALLNVESSAVAKSAHSVYNILQQMPPEKAIAGAAAAFLLMTDAYQVSPRKALEVSERGLRDARTTSEGSVLVGAVEDLLKNELA